MKPEILRELLRTIMRDNPDGSQKEIHDLCLKRCSSDEQLQLAIFEYWFGNSYRDFIVTEFEPGSTAVMPAERAATTQNVVGGVVAIIFLLFGMIAWAIGAIVVGAVVGLFGVAALMVADR